METLTAAAIATLLLTKMIEKLGENLADKLPELSSKAIQNIVKLKGLLWQKTPETASAIELVTSQPELMEQEPEKYSVEVLTEKIDLAAKNNSDIAEMIEVIDAEVRPELSQKIVQKIANSLKAKSFTAEKIFLQAEPGSTNVNQEVLNNADIQEDVKVKDIDVRA